jgi:hypothetical protein
MVKRIYNRRFSEYPAGNYLVTVSDSRGCSKQAQYSINRQPPINWSSYQTEFDCETKFVKQTFVAKFQVDHPTNCLVWQELSAVPIMK